MLMDVDGILSVAHWSVLKLAAGWAISTFSNQAKSVSNTGAAAPQDSEDAAKPKEAAPETESREAATEEDPTKGKYGRITITVKDGVATFHDRILNEKFLVSTDARCYKIMCRAAKDLTTKSFYGKKWNEVKRYFIHGDAKRFAAKEVYHEPIKSGLTQKPTKRHSGEWRLKTNDEIRAAMKA